MVALVPDHPLADRDAAGTTGEQGIEFGAPKDELAAHGCPAAGDELLDACGDVDLDPPG